MSDFFTVFMLPAIFLLFCILVAIFRFINGPTTPDRAVALDTVNTLIVSGMILAGAAFDEAIYIDVAIFYALLSYIATLYIAKHLENRRFKKQ